MEPFRGSFIGRAGDLDALERSVGDGTRLLTLLGPGGVGKTRLLARFVASAFVAERFAAAWFVDLSSARSREDVVSAVARAMGARTSQGAGEAQVGRALARRGKVLLALDNMEQLTDALPSLTGAWLTTATNLCVVGTSRVRLGLSGEVIQRVDPLAPEDALALFEERTKACRGPLDDDERALARRVVALLEGMPLALEMASARLTVLDVGELLAHLDRPLAVLVSARGEHERQGSIARVLERSWELLTERERCALEELAVFVGGFSFEGLRAMVGDDGALDVLHRLVDSSLLRRLPSRAPHARHAPWEVVREHALDRLAREGRLAAVQRRHALWAARFATAALARADEGDVHARAELVDEEANLASAARWARSRDDDDARRSRLALLCALEPVRVRGSGLESLAADLEDAVARAGALDPALSARARLAHARTLLELGRTDAAARSYDDALADARAVGDPTLQSLAMCGKGRLLAGTGAWAPALALFEEARAITNASSRARALAHACFQFYGSEAGASTQEIAAAADYVAICRRLHDDHELAFWLVQLARVESELARDRVAAERHFDEAMAVARATGDLRAEAFATFGLGAHELAYGDRAGAVALLSEAAAALEETGGRRYEAWARGFLGAALALAGDIARGRAELDVAVALATEVADAPRAAHLLAYRAAVRARQGDLDAEEDIAEARARMPPQSVYHAWTIDLCAAAVDAARANALTRAGGEGAADRAAVLSTRARACLARAGWPAGGRDAADARRAWPWGTEFYEPRIAMELCDAALDDKVPAGALGVASDASFVVLPDGRRVDLGARERLRRLLLTLARARADAGAPAVSSETLVAAVWPGERIQRAAAKNRLHVAVGQLRDLGLRGILVHHADGFRLDPGVPFGWLPIES